MSSLTEVGHSRRKQVSSMTALVELFSIISVVFICMGHQHKIKNRVKIEKRTNHTIKYKKSSANVYLRRKLQINRNGAYVPN